MAKQTSKSRSKQASHRPASSKVARTQRIARRLLVGESSEDLCREFGVSESEIERLRRQCDVELATEGFGSAALRWRQTLQLEGLVETALAAWRASATPEGRVGGDVKFLTLARQLLQDVCELWALAPDKKRPAASDSPPDDDGPPLLIEDPAWFGETPLYKSLLPHILDFQAKNGAAASGNGYASGNGHHRASDSEP